MPQAQRAIDTEWDVFREGDGRIVTVHTAYHVGESTRGREIVSKTNRSIYQPIRFVHASEAEGTMAAHLDNFDIRFGAHFPNAYRSCLRSRGVSA